MLPNRPGLVAQLDALIRETYLPAIQAEFNRSSGLMSIINGPRVHIDPELLAAREARWAAERAAIAAEAEEHAGTVRTIKRIIEGLPWRVRERLLDEFREWED